MPLRGVEWLGDGRDVYIENQENRFADRNALGSGFPETTWTTWDNFFKETGRATPPGERWWKGVRQECEKKGKTNRTKVDKIAGGMREESGRRESTRMSRMPLREFGWLGRATKASFPFYPPRSPPIIRRGAIR
jgi:hypothetical protein